MNDQLNFDAWTFAMTAPETARVATVRVAYSCQRCGEWFYVEQETRRRGDAERGACPICTGPLEYRGPIDTSGNATSTYEVPACDDQCTSARGTVCVCKCGGRNHGTGRTVLVTYVDGTPRLNLGDASKLARLAATRLPEIERAEQLASELVALLEARYAPYLARRRAGEWLKRGEFEQLRRWEDYRRQIRKAEKLRTPKGRLVALERIREVVAP